MQKGSHLAAFFVVVDLSLRPNYAVAQLYLGAIANWK